MYTLVEYTSTAWVGLFTKWPTYKMVSSVFGLPDEFIVDPKVEDIRINVVQVYYSLQTMFCILMLYRCITVYRQCSVY